MRYSDPDTLHEKSRRVPRGEKRRDEIAEVAQRVFLELGFTETTMQAIAASAGASKETLYRHFGSKEELFAEIIRTRAERVFCGLGEGPLPGAPKECLTLIGNNMLRLIIGEDSLSLYRLVIAEVPRAPELGRIFYEQGPAQVLRLLTAQIACATESGYLSCPDPSIAARLFLGALVGNRHMHALIAPESATMTDEMIMRHVDETVALFLARYGVSATAHSTTS
jgi:TetR/AcrR family transcriptional regulator, mexJK operon transcriptional repressor